MADFASTQPTTPAYLYLHPNESPVTPVLSLILDVNNFHSWCRSMTTTLSAKNKIQFI